MTVYVLLRFVSRGGHRRVTARRLSDEPLEVANEVGLIGVAELGGEVGPVAPRALRRVLCGFVETVPLDDPLGTDAYVLTEETFEGAFTRPGEANNISDFRDLAVVGDGVHDVKDGIGVSVALGGLCSEAKLRLCDHRRVLTGWKNRFFPLAVRCVEDVGDRDRPIRETCDGLPEERTEAARQELHAEDEAMAFELALDARAHDAEDARSAALDGEVDARVRDDVLAVGLAERPPQDPEAGHEQGEVLRWPVPYQVKALRSTSWMEDSARSFQPVLHKPSVGRLSRFFNHVPPALGKKGQ